MALEVEMGAPNLGKDDRKMILCEEVSLKECGRKYMAGDECKKNEHSSA